MSISNTIVKFFLKCFDRLDTDGDLFLKGASIDGTNRMKLGPIAGIREEQKARYTNYCVDSVCLVPCSNFYIIRYHLVTLSNVKKFRINQR